MIQKGDIALIGEKRIVTFLNTNIDRLKAINLTLLPERGIRPFIEEFSYTSFYDFKSKVHMISDDDAKTYIENIKKDNAQYNAKARRGVYNPFTNFFDSSTESVLRSIQNKKLGRILNHFQYIKNEIYNSKDPIAELMNTVFESPQEQDHKRYLLQAAYSHYISENTFTYPIKYTARLDIKSEEYIAYKELENILDQEYIKDKFPNTDEKYGKLKQLSIHTLPRQYISRLERTYENFVIDYMEPDHFELDLTLP